MGVGANYWGFLRQSKYCSVKTIEYGIKMSKKQREIIIEQIFTWRYIFLHKRINLFRASHIGMYNITELPIPKLQPYT